MKSQPSYIVGNHFIDSLAQRCLTFLRCWPLAEVRRYQMVTDALKKVTSDSDTPDQVVSAQIIQELRRQVAMDVAERVPAATPPVNRKSMGSNHWRYLWQKNPGQADLKNDRQQQDSVDKQSALRYSWCRIALLRRIILAFLVFVPAFFAAWGISTILPFHGSLWTEKLLIIISGVLFSWVAVGFWVAAIGFFTLMRNPDRYLLGKTTPDLPEKIDRTCRTAILFPVCGEDMNRVRAGIFSVYQSLRKTRQSDLFDFFLLSDSRDPDSWVTEEVQWRELCRDLGDPGNIYYRRRKVNLKRKSGNIADFCRRFGADYRYMVVFDADSIMSGGTLIRLVQLMEHHPRAGIIQTPPAVIGRETLHARIQQFANRVYAPLYAAGLHVLQLGDGSFWGHNAILRIKPFMEHCSLPRLSGEAPWGGDILSHDFVESALMRRAGWDVWLAYDLDGSYEEPPPTLHDELKRDRRWCSGNLQHMRLLLSKGFKPAYRLLFLNGIMNYLSAPLWLTLLLLSSGVVIQRAFMPLAYFPESRALFPQWPVWDPFGSIVLLSMTAALLFIPKLLACVAILVQKRAASFGGVAGLGRSLVGEMVYSAFLAPVRMLFHTRFVVGWFFRCQSGWASQNREDSKISWGEAIRFHGPGMMFALCWGIIFYFVNIGFLLWLLPIIIPMGMAVPVAVLSSRVEMGRFLSQKGFFLIPEERNPPVEIETMVNKHKELRQVKGPLRLHSTDGFVRAVLNPRVNELHRYLARSGRKRRTPVRRRLVLLRKALNSGPDRLSSDEKKRILQDELALWLLHKSVWSLPDNSLAREWFGRYTPRSP